MPDVESYIMRFNPEIQRRLRVIRSTGLKIFQKSEEKIYHAIPTFMVNGKDILNYGAYKNHITLYVGYDMAYLLKNKYPQYQYTKTTVKMPNSDTFPDYIIQEICELLNHFGSNWK